jgi:hypothetical protein
MRRLIATCVLAATATVGGLTTITAIGSGGTLADGSGPDTVFCCHPH